MREVGCTTQTDPLEKTSEARSREKVEMVDGALENPGVALGKSGADQGIIVTCTSPVGQAPAGIVGMGRSTHVTFARHQLSAYVGS